MSIVVDQEQTERVLRGPEGALAALRPGSSVVLMSTLAPAYRQALAVELSERQIDVVDCPVSGGSMGAEKGSPALVAGGDAATTTRCRAALETMGTIHPYGAVGMGMVAELANNAVGLRTIPLVREARTMAAAYGVDMDALMAVMRGHGQHLHRPGVELGRSPWRKGSARGPQGSAIASGSGGRQGHCSPQARQPVRTGEPFG